MSFMLHVRNWQCGRLGHLRRASTAWSIGTKGARSAGRQLWVVSRLIAAAQHYSRLRLQFARKRSLGFATNIGANGHKQPFKVERFRHFVTSITAPVASGWSGCRVGLAPTGKRRLITAHDMKGQSTDINYSLYDWSGNV